MFACCPQCEIFHASSRAVGQRASDIQGAQHAIGAAFVVLRTKRRWIAWKCVHAQGCRICCCEAEKLMFARICVFRIDE